MWLISVWFDYFFSSDILTNYGERLSMTSRQTANGKNETFALCLLLLVVFLRDLFKDYKKRIKSQR